jgi:hypothetical protein
MPETDDDWGTPQTDTIHDLNEDGPCIGVYQGFKVVTSTLGDSRLHLFVTPEGRRVQMWGKTHANRLLEGREGELVKIELTGNKLEMGPGRNPMIEFRLYSKGRQTPSPELPLKPLEAPHTEFPPTQEETTRPFENGAEGPLGADEAQLIRARRIASAARDAGLDDDLRGDLVDYYTFGETRHARDLSDAQANKVFQLINQIRAGKMDIRYDEGGKLYLEDAISRKRYR